MAFAQINDILVHYGDYGRRKAPVLVLVNSLGTDARIWEAVTARLQDRYRIIVYDKRGHGLSDAPERDYSLDDHIGDLSGLLDHLGVERFTLAGVSVGGLIAQGMALRHPYRITGVVLCDTAARIGAEAMWNERITLVRSGGMQALGDAVMMRWFTERYRQERPVEIAGWRNMFLRTPAAGYAGTCATLRDTDLREQVGSIAVPTLMLVGADDVSTPAELVRDTAALIPGARFSVIENAGHIPAIEQPRVLAEHISTFLNEAHHG
ncbi:MULTISPECIES: 3-oxoadipate enol-lactonase [unclassified Chelatococcus]|uniref:3-oxoadipate enol-lactonase n=1 Tax=unclassified Chelatococcus TaxID=2638111 RepID=UPI001BCE4A62|nr:MULTISPECIES: 3-oxoadipate enol-lactonase [unclassified Chelatococcus]CAH1651832.1 Beta-ketoadipate enol-lactone hydrolase [Hyphomicrobiales bacterium]MBS7743114.1 3-oxoadipate enol-lactonase [Chelatococcus sp. HY11]MBX3541768.1 3-oxoadipate enol-lactonase [Chelatococcus sp.]MCO5074340.1 3-oxoadipate enol-lactonase [Chelatococcus sp.]CAH1693505.1 Beta-ketoadipate enol-lactone hydrolase [Hyphomicrobiales bacterium]